MGGWLSSGPTYAFCILLLSCHVWMSQISSCLLCQHQAKRARMNSEVIQLIWDCTHAYSCFFLLNTQTLAYSSGITHLQYPISESGIRVIRSSSLHIWKDKQTQSTSKGVPENAPVSQCRKGQNKPGLFTIVVFSPFLSISGWCAGF